MRLLERFICKENGYLLLEVLIAMAAVGTITFYIINYDILPGLQTKWENQQNTLQNEWIK